MSLVGTRPPTVDEYEQYEIGHRKRLPLLADTLEQTLVYYHLRMKVEKELVDDICFFHT